MIAPRLLAALLIGLAAPAALAAPAPEAMHTRDGWLIDDDLGQVDHPFDAGSLAQALQTYEGPVHKAQSDDFVRERVHVFADAQLRVRSHYESTTYELYPHRPLARAEAFRFCAPMLAQSPFAKGLPAKPAKTTARSVEWEADAGASYTLTFDLDGKGRVVKVTLDWGV